MGGFGGFESVVALILWRLAGALEFSLEGFGFASVCGFRMGSFGLARVLLFESTLQGLVDPVLGAYRA